MFLGLLISKELKYPYLIKKPKQLICLGFFNVKLIYFIFYYQDSLILCIFVPPQITPQN